MRYQIKIDNHLPPMALIFMKHGVDPPDNREMCALLGNNLNSRDGVVGTVIKRPLEALEVQESSRRPSTVGWNPGNA